LEKKITRKIFRFFFFFFLKTWLAEICKADPRVCSISVLCLTFQVPDRARFHRPQHLQVVRESVGDVDASNGLRIEDAPPIGQVALLKQKHSGIGGERLNYVAKDDWDCRKSTEERLGWSAHSLHPLSIRETIAGRDAEGLPKWVRLEKQARLSIFCRMLKPNTFANFEVPAKIANQNFFFCYFGRIVNQIFFNNYLSCDHTIPENGRKNPNTPFKRPKKKFR
jgi:hypothetical protein